MTISPRRLIALLPALLLVTDIAAAQPDLQTISRIAYKRVMVFDSFTFGRMKISGDGSRIVFSTTNKQIHTVGTDGSDAQLVFDYATYRVGPGGAPFVDINANGTKILWTDTRDEIFVSDADGGNRTSITQELTSSFDVTRPLVTSIPPRLTADGSQVIFTNTPGAGDSWADVSGMFRANADGSGATQLFSYRELAQSLFGTDGTEFNGNAAFTTDFHISDTGQRMVWGSLADGPALITYDGGSFRKFVELLPIEPGRFDMSPDGGVLAYVAPSGPDRGMVVVDVFGGGARRLLAEPGTSARVDLNQDGTAVSIDAAISNTQRLPLGVYHSFGDARLDVVTACVGNQMFWTTRQSFSADGMRVAFLNQASPPELWVAELNPGSIDEGPMLSGPSLDPSIVTADGSTSSSFSVQVDDGGADISDVCYDALLGRDAYQFRALRGGPLFQSMVDDGTNGDATAGDGIYTSGEVSRDLASTPPGEYAIRFHVVSDEYIDALDVAPFEITDQSPPAITSFEPDTAFPGDRVTIVGENFDPDGIKVTFNGIPAVILSVTPTQIVVIVPPGVDAGSASVVITNGSGLEGEPGTFTVIAPTSFVVNSTEPSATDYDLDDGLCDFDADEPGQQCTLSIAVQNANLTAEIDEITFAIPGTGVPEIRASASFTAPVVLDGSTQPAGRVMIRGSISICGSGTCQEERAGASEIRGIVFRGNADPPPAAITIGAGADGTVVTDVFIGTDATGSSFGGLTGGIRIFRADHVRIDNNVLAGIPHSAISAFAEGTLILNNRIGTDSAGTSLIRNPVGGVSVTGLGDTPTEIRLNVVSGNGSIGEGPRLGDAITARYNVVIMDNRIGTDVSGNVPLGNIANGIDASQGPIVIDRNLISANDGFGIIASNNQFQTTGFIPAHEIRIVGNRIGTNLDLTEDFGNGIDGVNVTGARITVERNVVSGNGRHGIKGGSNLSEGVVIRDNWVGTTPDLLPLGNSQDGMHFDEYFLTADYLITNNVVAANGGNGITLVGPRYFTVLGNRFGLGGRFDDDLGNGGWGIELRDYVSARGRELASDRNTFAGNTVRHNVDGGIRVVGFMNTFVGNDIRYHPVGMYLASGDNVVRSNYFVGNETGIISEGSNEITGNFISSFGSSTGIRLASGESEIRGNSITDDAGDGIRIESGATASISANNLAGSAGFAVNNLNESVVVAANDNWWGDASGPAGSGPGGGDAVSEGVDFGNWRDSQVGLVVTAGGGEILTPVGSIDTLRAAFLNWLDPDDVVDVEITESDRWLKSSLNFSLSLSDSNATMASIVYEVPAGAAEGMTNTIQIRAVSQTNPTVTDVDSFVVAVYRPQLSEIFVSPDTVEVVAGDSVVFGTRGIDQENGPVKVDVEWTATGGIIDAAGLFVAGQEAGIFSVTATDRSSGLRADAVVNIATVVATDEGVELPDEFELSQNYPNPFNPTTTIVYSVPAAGHVNVTVFDVVGRQVAVVADGERPAGRYTARFDGSRLASGIYFYRLAAADVVITRKMILVK